MMPETVIAADADAIRDVIAPGTPGMRANVPADLEVTSESSPRNRRKLFRLNQLHRPRPRCPATGDDGRLRPPTMPASAIPPVQQQPAAAVDMPEAYLIDLDGSTHSQRFQIMTDNLSVGRSTTRMTVVSI